MEVYVGGKGRVGLVEDIVEQAVNTAAHDIRIAKDMMVAGTAEADVGKKESWGGGGGGIVGRRTLLFHRFFFYAKREA